MPKLTNTIITNVNLRRSNQTHTPSKIVLRGLTVWPKEPLLSFDTYQAGGVLSFKVISSTGYIAMVTDDSLVKLFEPFHTINSIRAGSNTYNISNAKVTQIAVELFETSTCNIFGIGIGQYDDRYDDYPIDAQFNCTITNRGTSNATYVVTMFGQSITRSINAGNSDTLGPFTSTTAGNKTVQLQHVQDNINANVTIYVPTPTIYGQRRRAVPVSHVLVKEANSTNIIGNALRKIDIHNITQAKYNELQIPDRDRPAGGIWSWFGEPIGSGSGSAAGAGFPNYADNGFLDFTKQSSTHGYAYFNADDVSRRSDCTGTAGYSEVAYYFYSRFRTYRSAIRGDMEYRFTWQFFQGTKKTNCYHNDVHGTQYIEIVLGGRRAYSGPIGDGAVFPDRKVRPQLPPGVTSTYFELLEIGNLPATNYTHTGVTNDGQIEGFDSEYEWQVLASEYSPRTVSDATTNYFKILVQTTHPNANPARARGTYDWSSNYADSQAWVDANYNQDMAVRNVNALSKVRYFIIRDSEGTVWRFERRSRWSYRYRGTSRVGTNRYNPYFGFRYMPLPNYDKENVIDVETIKTNSLNTIQFIDFDSTPINSFTARTVPYLRAIKTNKQTYNTQFSFGVPSWVTKINSPLFVFNYAFNTSLVYTPTLPVGDNSSFTTS